MCNVQWKYFVIAKILNENMKEYPSPHNLFFIYKEMTHQNPEVHCATLK